MSFLLKILHFFVPVGSFLRRSISTFFSSFGAFHASMMLFFQRLFGGMVLSNWFLLLTLLGPLVWKIIALAGFSAVTYTGVSSLSNVVVGYLQSRTSVLPPPVFAIMGIMKLDVGFKMIVSAGLVKYTLIGWNKLTDTARRMRWSGLPSGGSDPVL